MPYQVVEKLTNITDVTYENVDDFVSQCFYQGYDLNALIIHWGNKLIDEGLGTEQERMDFLTAMELAEESFGSWDSTNQSCIKTTIWNSESDYLLRKDIGTRLRNVLSSNVTTTEISAG